MSKSGIDTTDVFTPTTNALDPRDDGRAGFDIHIMEWWQKDPPMHGVGATLDEAIANAKPCDPSRLPWNRNVTVDKPFIMSPPVEDLGDPAVYAPVQTQTLPHWEPIDGTSRSQRDRLCDEHPDMVIHAGETCLVCDQKNRTQEEK